MSAVPTTAASAANTSNAVSNPVAQVLDTQGTGQPANGDTLAVDWDSEIQLVSSLAKLQELERKIHGLRQVLPDGLLEPLLPISNPSQLPPNTPVAGPPAALRDGMEHAARSGLASIDQFQSIWRGPQMKPIWAHVESRVKESNGQYLQPSGIWEKDYGALLDELTKAEKTTDEERQRAEEEVERAKLQTSNDQWQTATDNLAQRDVPGLRVIKGEVANTLAVALARAGIIFLVRGLQEPGVAGVSEWQVSNKVAPGRTPTKLELAVFDSLRMRPRKWDLAFLLDMIASYSDIKQTPCVKCNKLTNNAAQLPTTRRAQSTQASPSDTSSFTFDAFHTSCA